MIRQLKPSFVLLMLLALLTGILYPLLVTTIVQVAFRSRANGSLAKQNGDWIGSALVGQDFSNPGYFWGRPSSTAGHPYNPYDPDALTGSSGSNFGPLSKTFVDAVRLRVEAWHAADPNNIFPIPVDLVTASASGLDPDISLAAAYYQVPRVARARGMSEASVRNLVDRNTTNRQFGFLGEPRVNVLFLNLALDEIK